jgi:hypothetical protein
MIEIESKKHDGPVQQCLEKRKKVALVYINDGFVKYLNDLAQNISH